jgi:glycosyltransferase involved in cell wall biosynthesis
MKILFLVRSLARGGAERQLVELATGLHQQGHGVTVVVFYDGGPLSADLLKATGITPRASGKSGRWDMLALARCLSRTIADERPNIIHSFLTTANIAALIAKFRSPRSPLVWGILGNDLDSAFHSDYFARFTTWIERPLARCADLIISDSHSGRARAIDLGFPADRTIAVLSGADLERFRPDAAGRRRVRAEWGVASREILIGLAARVVPIKNHAGFLRTAALLAAVRKDVRFAFVGDASQGAAAPLQRLASDLGLADRVIWAGPRDDMLAVYSAFDIACSSSFNESFPNALLEAMACGRLCVATDVGDSREILGEFGRIVPPRDSEALARALASLCDELGGPAEFNTSARQRISEKFPGGWSRRSRRPIFSFCSRKIAEPPGGHAAEQVASNSAPAREAERQERIREPRRPFSQPRAHAWNLHCIAQTAL